VVSYDYFADLIHSVGASSIFLKKAHRDGALIEGVCLYVSAIDALLRLAIIYSRTQKAPEHSYAVAKGLVRQDDGERTFSEREIYRIALTEGVVSPELHDELQKMYTFRNRVVHRFNISPLTYAAIAEACVRFDEVYQQVMKIIDVLENGPHGTRPQSEADREDTLERLAAKIQGARDAAYKTP